MSVKTVILRRRTAKPFQKEVDTAKSQALGPYDPHRHCQLKSIACFFCSGKGLCPSQHLGKAHPLTPQVPTTADTLIHGKVL